MLRKNVSTIALAANVTLKGRGVGSVIKRLTGTGLNLITASGLSSISLKDFSIAGNSAATSGTVNNIFMTGCNNVIIDNISSNDSRLHGISFQSGTDVANDTVSQIRNCNINTALGYGIEAANSSRISIVHNRVIKTTGFGIIAYGSTAFSVKGIQINNNIVTESATSGIVIPFVNGGTVLTPGIEDVSVNGNIVEGCSQHGIMVQVRFSSVTGNVVTGNGTTASHQGILINCLTSTVTANSVTKSSGVGIDFGDCKRVTCTGNVVEESGIMGIELNSVEDFSVTGNILSNNCQKSDAGPLSSGILVHLGTGGYVFPGSSINGVISNNIIRSGPNQLYGIKTTAASENIRLIGNDALSAGSIRDYEILTPSGKFTCIGNTVGYPTLTPASTVTISQVGNYYYVNSGTTINSIITDGGTYEFGRQIVLKFNGVVIIGNGTGNIYLASGFTAGNGSVLVLVRADAGGWIEVSRKL